MSSTSLSTYTSIFSCTSSVAQAWIHSAGIAISRSIRSLDEDKLRGLNENYLIPRDSDTFLSKVRGLSHELPLHLSQDLSPSGSLSVVSRHIDDKPTLEVSSDSSFLRIDASDKHGKFVSDSWFGGHSWSSDEKFFVYVAMEKSEKASACFEIKKDTDAGAFSEDRRSKFDFVEDWGEKYVGVSSLVICILDVATKRITVIRAPQDKLTIGQPQIFSPSPGHYYVTYTAWKTEPRRLGMIYCYQRPCSIYSTDVTALLTTEDRAQLGTYKLEHRELSASIHLARSSRISPLGRSLVFLGSQSGFPSHGGPSQLFRIKIQAPDQEHGSPISVSFGEPELLIDNVEVPPHRCKGEGEDHQEGEVDFPGLFTDQLPRRCFLDEESIAMSSTWGSVERVLVVDLERRTVKPLTELGKILDDLSVPETSLASCSVLCVSPAPNKALIFSASSPSSPPRLGFARIRADEPMQLQICGAASAPASDLIKSDSASAASPASLSINAAVAAPLRWRILRLEKDGIPFEAVLLQPAKPIGRSHPSESLPLIVIPHGGPHGCTTTAFSPATAFLCSHLNAAALHVNYRGSTGFGAGSIRSLLGRIGESDVQDMIAATQCALDLGGFDKSRIAVVGGSHGGFLGGHLIGQHPELFKTAVLRNPVLNIPGMVGVTDIPDWCHVEALGGDAYDFSTYDVCGPERLAEMFARSPVAHIDKVRAPTLIAVGSKDLRVPASQGIEFYHLLRARAVPTRLLVFPEDVHAIDKPASEVEQWIATAEWLEKYL